MLYSATSMTNKQRGIIEAAIIGLQAKPHYAVSLEADLLTQTYSGYRDAANAMASIQVP
jgi:hypothetical protein